MTDLPNVARGISPWGPAGHSGPAWPVAQPIGGGLLWLAIIVTAALVVSGLRQIERSPPVELRRDIVGVARIIDGDTIDIAGTRIRLAGIDAPESDQTCTDSNNREWSCGKAATQAIAARIAGRPLKCETSGLDRYRRMLATCALPNGSDINAWMVRRGWALAYYSEAYRAEEDEAHAAGGGIWAGRFVPPWEWRRQHRHWWMGSD